MVATLSIREMVKSAQRDIGAGSLVPQQAAELLMKLTALLGNINDEIREADSLYAAVLLACLDSDEAANRAKIRAETTPAYQRRREARDTKELAQEMIRAIKYYLRSAEEEMRLSR